MAPYVPLPAGVQIQLIHQLGGEKIQNRLWFVFDNPPFSFSDLEGLLAGVDAWWTTWILPHLSIQLYTEKVEAFDWSGSSPALPVVWLIEQLGGRDYLAHSANVAVVVPFLWTLGERNKKNKHYVPGAPLDAILLNTVQPDFNDALFEGYAALVDAARLFSPVLNWRWVVTSQWQGGSLRDEQYWQTCQGVPQNTLFKVGQRRKRLPQP